jgi:hypothetical protein
MLYEFLASGKPVVSTEVSQLVAFGNLRFISCKEEFLMNLDKALSEDRESKIHGRIDLTSYILR